MTIEETIKKFQSNAEYERTHGNLQGCLEFRQFAEWLRKYQKIQEIVTNNELEWGNTSVRAKALLDVKKVVEDD